jgi:hypothetical protein
MHPFLLREILRSTNIQTIFTATGRMAGPLSPLQNSLIGAYGFQNL